MALIAKGNDWLQDEFPAELQFWENMAISRANCQNIGLSHLVDHRHLSTVKQTWLPYWRLRYGVHLEKKRNKFDCMCLSPGSVRWENPL